MDKLDPQLTWAVVIAILTLILLVLNVYEKVSGLQKKAKEPNDRQDERLSKFERRLENVERKLDNDDRRLSEIKKGDRATQRALIALLDHALDGNNLEQMEKAKNELNNYLIEK
ncbi:MAG: hypothetical protein E7575_05500 [Ruminococcaceae bacterium]|nr:hypothetical protein [Oscillospiraceae bacterium]